MMMRFGLFGDDPLLKPITDALKQGADGHRLIRAVRTSPESDALLHGHRDVSFVEHWEDLLVAKDIDAVLVGGTDPKILEGTKQLAAAGISILFQPSAAQGSTFAYEMSLIRDDNRVAIFPIFWHRYDSAAARMKKAVDDGELGRILFLQLKRSIATPVAGSPIAQQDVDAQLLLDVDLPRWMIGDYNQVTGLRTAATNDAVLIQSVVMAGRSLPEFNWSIDSAEGRDLWSLTVRGERGSAELSRDAASRHWVCMIDGQRTEGNEQNSAEALLSAFSTSKSGVSNSTSDQDSTVSEWGELVKSFETIDATHRSVRRRRTIELHFEPMSERAIFKTQMTAIGCRAAGGDILLVAMLSGNCESRAAAHPSLDRTACDCVFALGCFPGCAISASTDATIDELGGIPSRCEVPSA